LQWFVTTVTFCTYSVIPVRISKHGLILLFIEEFHFMKTKTIIVIALITLASMIVAIGGAIAFFSLFAEDYSRGPLG